jgi:hypothetical protein
VTREVLELDDLRPYLLLQNGNYLYKVPFRGGHAVLKVYYGSRSTLEMLAKSFGNVVFEGQTSYMPRTRLEMERECLALWRRHGFRVFDVYDDVEVRAPGCPEGGYLLLEYVAAEKLIDRMRDAGRPVEERLATWRRFLPEWGRRHELAVREREPRLVHENGDTKHVMLVGDDFLWFDFEMVYRSRSRVEEYVGHEIIQYVWNLLRSLPPEMHGPLLAETVEHYPHPRFLAAGRDVFLNHPKLLHRWGRSLDRRRARSRKPSSKYAVAERIEALLR